MKIYNEIVVDIESGKVLSENYFEYQGPLSLCNAGNYDNDAQKILDPVGLGAEKPSTDYPGLSTEEKDVIKAQTKILTDTIADSDATKNALFKSIGMKQGDDGKWVEMSDTEKYDAMSPSRKSAYTEYMRGMGLDVSGNKLTEDQLLEGMTDVDKQAYKANQLSTQRYIDALNGNVSISPALEKELGDEQARIEETLNRKLGADWLASTPGQSAFMKLLQKNNLVREEARRGEITAGANRFATTSAQGLSRRELNTNNLTTNEGINQTRISNLANVPGRNLGTMTSAGTILQPLATQRSNEFAATMQNQANQAAQKQGTVQIAAAAAAAAA